MLNINKIKKDFPVFKYNPGLNYLDSTATSLKPKTVIEKIKEYYEKYPANISRSLYKIAEKATQEYEASRKVVAEFINAQPEEIIFTRNTTESLNLIAYGLEKKTIKKGDEIVISIMEHHSNFVPWQQLALRTKAKLKIIDIDDQGYLDIYNQQKNIDPLKLKKFINKKTKIVAITHVSNVLGTINPIKNIAREIKKINPKTIIVIDSAQGAPHLLLDVSQMNIDFLAFSSHKMLGPTGVGILWGKKTSLNQLPPYLFGGEMIEEVQIKKSSFKDTPFKFEAGTPAIAEVIALKEAIFYLQKIGLENIKKHENNLTEYALNKLKKEFKNEIKILGPENLEDRVGVISFSFKNYHPHDIGQILSEKNICIRSGHHCAMPLHQRLKLPASNRISFYIYNRRQDIDQLIIGLKMVDKIFNKL